jgi:hypothetical protein
MPVEMGDDMGDDRGADEGPGAVVDQHQIGCIAAQGLEPAGHRKLACGAADDGAGQGQFAHRLVIERLVVLADDHLHARDPGVAQEGFDRMAQHRLAADRWYCLGRSPPARKPAPAATMTAAAVMDGTWRERRNRALV